MSLILYSAVGGTDPISNNHDGSLLHICRHRKPDKVYLLVSMEMGMFQKHDQRYTYCIEQLGLMLNHKFEVVLINEENLDRPDSFDEVYPIIKRDILRIRSENKNDELIVNIASGTPAMKYCLQFLSALADYNFTPISVTTPERSSNPHREDRYNYNPKAQWENNKDNDPNHIDRTYETKSLLMLSEFYKHTMIKFIQEYNYSAALTFAKTGMFFSSDITEMLEAFDARLKLNTANAQTDLRKYGFELPYPNKNRQVFEYYLNLKVKLHKEEFADFIRAVTPLMTVLLELCLEHCEINLKIYTTTNSEGIRKWNEVILAGTDLDDILNSSFANFKYGTVYNSHLRVLAEAFLSKSDKDKALYRDIVKLDRFEESVRNRAAHKMVNADPASIKKIAGITPQEAFDCITRVLPILNVPVAGKSDSYNKMNELILSKLQ